MPDIPDSDPSTVPFPELLQRACSDDESAINALFERYYPRVQELAHASLEFDARRGRPWLSARFSTSDVVQEVFRSAFTHLQAFGGSTEESFVGFLAMIVRNRIVDAIRFHQSARRDGRMGVGQLDEAQFGASAQGAETLAEKRDSADRLRQLIQELPEREQLLVRGRLEGTATFEELTERLGYSSVTTARRSFFALQARLALRLAPDSGEQAR